LISALCAASASRISAEALVGIHVHLDLGDQLVELGIGIPAVVVVAVTLAAVGRKHRLQDENAIDGTAAQPSMYMLVSVFFELRKIVGARHRVDVDRDADLRPHRGQRLADFSSLT
jgi:hypothetical protein